MASLKQSLKQVLIKNRQNKYDNELAEKKMSYDSWIKKQEEQIVVDNIIVSQSLKCLKNDLIKTDYEGFEKQNEGFHSKNEVSCQYFEVFDKKEGKASAKSFLLVPPEISAGKNVDKILPELKNTDADVILFQVSDGNLADFALQLLYKRLRENKNIILIYGDEDVQKDGERCCPFLKPDWSPDTFLSSYYFGSLTAIQRAVLCSLAEEETERRSFGLYELCKAVIDKCNGFGIRKEPDKEIICHIPEVLFHADCEGYQTVREWKLPMNTQGGAVTEIPGTENALKHKERGETVSVIIPSKDNPPVLFTCIHSLLQKTKADFDYEIIIVDNGSNERNRAEIEAEILRIESELSGTNKEDKKLNQENSGGKRSLIRYFYHPMTFNFSEMCNIGADYARGNYLLFLNDDMEIIQEDWLVLLMEKARLPYAGAVGAKLLYPDSSVIQHAGITNLRVGPAHKLQFLSDEVNHYYGRNIGVHDVMAVTGACLLVKKEIFDRVGGFEKELAVAFNDVDLCYKIFEAGYYNIVRNDVVLYHHESLSRGKDGESEEKQKRLLREKDVLYERHQKLYGKDPFYHKYLTNDMLESEYSPAYHYQVTLTMPWAKVKTMARLPENVQEDNCVVIGMEGAMDIYKWKYGVAPGRGETEPKEEELGYYFQGYTFVIGANNACYKNTLLLENKGTKQVFAVEVQRRYRPDIKKNLKDQLNVDLTGFAAKVRWEDIPKGEYRFAMLAEDTCSRQKLVSYSSWVLQVDGLMQQVSDTLPRNQ